MADKKRFAVRICVFVLLLLAFEPVLVCEAVTSRVTRHRSSEDFLKGDANDVVIGSRGTIQLGRRAEVLVKRFDPSIGLRAGKLTTRPSSPVLSKAEGPKSAPGEPVLPVLSAVEGSEVERVEGGFRDVWSINSIVVHGDKVYIGTSPNGGVYAFSEGELKEVYSAQPVARAKSREPNEPNDSNAVETERRLANEHIFAMATDVAGRLLVGISGQRCALCRLEGGEMKVLFEPNDANYIFAITVDKAGDIYLGTGPQGKVYRLDSLGKKAELIYDSPDRNILSLAQGPDGLIYAGSDSRGLIYKINPPDVRRVNPRTKDATVLYDSEQQEITALLFFGEDLYAAATLADVIQAETMFAAQPPRVGRPEPQPEEEPPWDGGGDSPSTLSTSLKTGSLETSGGGTKLQVANTRERPGKQPEEHKGPPAKPPKPAQASFIYKVTRDGFVTDIFSETAVFFCLAAQGKELLVGTGNSDRIGAQLFAVEPASEEQTIVYEDRQASQITAVAVAGDDIYVGTANPARMVKLAKVFAREGTYTSELVDAGQPARWGKLQIEADVPHDCNMLVCCRSGNVKDVNDASFSKWTELADVNGPVQLDCPAGRFCQYKLVLRGDDEGLASPIIREVAVADTVPNLAPKVESVSVTRVDAVEKSGVFKVSCEVKDDNGDKLIYKIDFRKVGRTGWIEVEDGLESSSFEWDSRTVEDGRYEIRVTASDERSNTPDTKLAGSRVSEAVVVDNTGPVVSSHTIQKAGKTVTLKMNVSDELSAVGKVEYTVDSDANWMGVLPDDLVYDTTSEDFTIVVDKLSAGQHVIALKLADDVGNTTYKTFEVNIDKSETH